MLNQAPYIPNLENTSDCYSDFINYQSNPSKRKKFTPQEDQTLRLLLNQNESYNWQYISEFLPGRTAKQCRDRYANYLSKDISNEPWRKEEDEILLMYLSFIGTKWVEISHHIPGRSGNNVKNRWYKHLCKFYSFIPGNANSLTNKIMVKMNQISAKPKENNMNEKSKESIKKKYSISSLLV